MLTPILFRIYTILFFLIFLFVDNDILGLGDHKSKFDDYAEKKLWISFIYIYIKRKLELTWAQDLATRRHRRGVGMVCRPCVVGVKGLKEEEIDLRAEIMTFFF